MKYIVTVNGNKYEVEVEAAHGESAITNTNVILEDNPYPIPQKGEGEVIASPMPGKILAVKVSKGQTVRKGDVLFVLEAMKMENEIIASTDGVISDIFVERDTSVNVGDKLASIS